jgi:hypothetical protein
MKKRKTTEPAAPAAFETMEQIQRHNPISAETTRLEGLYADLTAQLDESRGTLAEIVSRPSGDVDANTQAAVEVELRIQVLESQVEGARQNILNQLDRDRDALGEIIGVQRAFHSGTKLDARQRLKEQVEALFEKRAAAAILRRHGDDGNEETESRRLKDQLSSKSDKIRQLKTVYYRHGDESQRSTSTGDHLVAEAAA